MSSEDKPKIYVLDTSSALREPYSFRKLGERGSNSVENVVVIVKTMLRELDEHVHKGQVSGVYESARSVLRLLDGVSEKGLIYRSVEEALKSPLSTFSAGGILMWYSPTTQDEREYERVYSP